MSQIAYVKLSDLHLWTDNPRLGIVESETAEIIGLIKNQQTKSGNKLIALASEIATSGIIEPIGVLRHPDGFMVVKEGNRRVSCLKLLKDPKIIPTEFHQLRESFTKLKAKAKVEVFSSIPARIYSEGENEELEKWIELRHNGVQEGKGLDTWGANEKENWNKYRGKNTPLLDFHNYLVSEYILDDYQINSINKTNWERILGSVGRSYLGLDLKDGKYAIKIPLSDFKKRLTKTVSNLNGQSVGVVYDNRAIKNFFDSINFDEQEPAILSTPVARDEPKSTLDKNTVDLSDNSEEQLTNNAESVSIDTDDVEVEENTQIPIDNNEVKKRRYTTKPAPLLSNLICDLKSTADTDGIIRLTTELKKMSKDKDYTKYPIATAMLMRSLLEQALIYYLKKRNKWNKFCSSRKNEPTLTEILDKYVKDTDIFDQDKNLDRYYKLVFDTPGLKEYFNMIVHHPHKFGATPEALDAIIAKSGYTALIQHIIDYHM